MVPKYSAITLPSYKCKEFASQLIFFIKIEPRGLDQFNQIVILRS